MIIDRIAENMFEITQESIDMFRRKEMKEGEEQ